MNQQDQQAIEELFQHLNQATAQAGPRDAAAEELIKRRVQQAPPGLLYQMAQTLVAQQHTINELRSQLIADQRQGGAPAGFAPPQGAGYRQAYGQPQYQQPNAYQQPGYQQPGRQGGGFLDGVGNMFDGDRDREYDDGYRDGFAAGDDYQDQNDYQDQDQGGYDDNGFDDNGGFDSGDGDIF